GFGGAVVNDDVGALLRKAQSDGAPKTFGGAGDEGDAIEQRERGVHGIQTLTQNFAYDWAAPGMLAQLAVRERTDGKRHCNRLGTGPCTRGLLVCLGFHIGGDRDFGWIVLGYF